MTARSIIVIPCYNEAARLNTELLAEFVESQDRFDLLLVNDGSRDATSSVLTMLQQRAPGRISVLSQPQNAGKAAAVLAGVNRALDCSPPFVGFWDADLATPLEDALLFADYMSTRDHVLWVFGSRVKMLGTRIERKAYRHYLGRVFATAVSLTLGLGIYDSQCGAKLFRTHEVTRSVFRDPFLSRWIFDVELIARMIQMHRSSSAPMPTQAVVELPVSVWVDIPGSKLRLKDFLRAVLELRQIRKRYLRTRGKIRRGTAKKGRDEVNLSRH